MLYPAKDWKEALQRIFSSGWYVTILGKPINDDPKWTFMIHSEPDYPRSTERYIDYALESEGGVTKAIMRGYKKWRDAQLEGDEEE